MICGIPYAVLRSIGKGYTIGETIRNIGIKMAFCITLFQSALGMKAMSWAMNNVCWFLSSLFMIYMICPFLMKMINYIEDRWISFSLIGIVCIILLIFYLFTNIQKITFFDDLNYGSPYFRFLFVMFGMLLERVYRYISDHNRKVFEYIEYLSVAVAVIWFFSRNQMKEYIYLCRLIDILICAFLLLVIALGRGKIVQFLCKKQSIILGNMSMYIFIIHFPVILYLDYIFEKCNIRFWLKSATGIIEVIAILMITVIIVWLVAKGEKDKIYKLRN